MRGMSATWLSPTNILSHRKVPFQKMLPPHGKILKKGPDKISNKVAYVYCVSKAVGQTNTRTPKVVPCLQPAVPTDEAGPVKDL
jgi:hypothetical protein